jgi:hypothetical protein
VDPVAPVKPVVPVAPLSPGSPLPPVGPGQLVIARKAVYWLADSICIYNINTLI